MYNFIILCYKLYYTVVGRITRWVYYTERTVWCSASLCGGQLLNIMLQTKYLYRVPVLYIYLQIYWVYIRRRTRDVRCLTVVKPRERMMCFTHSKINRCRSTQKEKILSPPRFLFPQRGGELYPARLVRTL